MPKTDPTKLLGEFDETSLEAWRLEVERLLRGAPFARRMFTRTWEGLTVNPMYTGADTADLPWLESLPGQAPFVRGNHAAGYHGAPWLVAQEYRCPTSEDFNRNVRSALQRGETAVNLILDHASKMGRDPDQVTSRDVGDRGTSISSLADLATALQGIDLSVHPLMLQAANSALPVTAMVAALVRRDQGSTHALQGCVGCSPSAGLARVGDFGATPAQINRELAILTRWAVTNAPRMRTLPVFESAWHDGGADLALSLGLTLAEAVTALLDMVEQGISLPLAAARIQFNLEIGTDFFMEMAKLRALRLLWSRMLTASGRAPADTRTFIHCRTARRCQTVLAPQVNLLRGTTGAMSAVFGGTDSLHVTPFDEVDRLPDEFSSRLARNIQLILAQECHFDQVTDPAGGSWYVESLTRDLAEAAWAKFQAVEGAGGLEAALVSGWVQEQVATAAAARAADFAVGRAAQVGTSRYAEAGAKALPTTELDSEKLSRERSASIADQRRSTTQEEHMLVLSRLEKIMDCPDDEVFEALVAAAEAGATLSELTSALRDDSEAKLTAEPIPLRRDAAPFEALRARTAAVRERTPAAGRVFLACLGDFARYMPRLDFVRGFFAVGDFETSGEEFYTTPAAVVAAARGDGARTVVLVGLDETYAEQAAEVARALTAGPDGPRVVLAGAPGADEAELRAAGVHSFIHVRSDRLAALAALLPQEEVQS